jgi:hypothetical protein
MFELKALAKCLQLSSGFGSKIFSQLVLKDVDQKRSAYPQIQAFVLRSTPSLHLHLITHPVRLYCHI